ncbi:HET-domain-containing protein [Stipitochalara longipes BDJ]|nr:HET-domain-containing protein [Stipitochalara longipes BDJ]
MAKLVEVDNDLYSMAEPEVLCRLTNLSLKDGDAAKQENETILPDFKYEPLPFDGLFRLIDLHYGAPSDDLVCTIFVERLGRRPFTAISYCWGSTERPHLIKCGEQKKIVVDGVDYYGPAEKPTGVIKITENLKNLLLALRTEDTYVTLWIDSICINQDDTDEKTKQVKVMNLIYDNSSSTVVYLGEANRETEAAMECAKKLAAMKDWPRSKVPQFLPDQRQPIDPPLVGKQGELQFFLDGWRAFTRLLDRDWFKRIWVIQEVILSRLVIVQCGNHSIRWDVIVDACQVVLRNNMYELDHMIARCAIVLRIDSRRRGWEEVRRQIRESGKVDLDTMPEFVFDMDLAMLQMWTHHCGATDPRDKVFALRNICIPKILDLLPPIDYSMSLAEVYVRSARYWFLTQPTRPLQFLTCVDNSIDAEELPSWCPDWRKKWKSKPLSTIGNKKGAARDIPAVATFPEIPIPFKLPLHLTVRGFYLMTIKAVEKMKLPEEWKTARHSDMINEFIGPYPTTILGYHEAFLRAVNPKVPEDFDGPKERPFTYWDFMRAVSKGNTLRPASVDVEGETQYISVEISADMGSVLDNQHPRAPFTQTILYNSLPIWYYNHAPVPQEDAVFGRLFFISTHGFMGLVPGAAKAGDHICVFLSGATPVVLRPKTGGDGKLVFGFVGECYVYGLMNHEPLDGLPSGLLQDFVLE